MYRLKPGPAPLETKKNPDATAHLREPQECGPTAEIVIFLDVTQKRLGYLFKCMFSN